MYTLDIRKLVLKMYSKLKSLRLVQSITNISKSTIARWNINILPFKKEHKKNIHIPIIIDTIQLISKINPFYNIYDVQLYLKNLNINCSYNLIRCVMRKDLKLSYKKTKLANYLNDKLLKEKTAFFCSQFKNLFNTTSFIASIDEVGFSSNLNPLHAWSEKGKRNYIKNKLDIKNRKNKSVCTCITSDGKLNYTVSTTPYNKISFLDFIIYLKILLYYWIM